MLKLRVGIQYFQQNKQTPCYKDILANHIETVFRLFLNIRKSGDWQFSEPYPHFLLGKTTIFIKFYIKK